MKSFSVLTSLLLVIPTTTAFSVVLSPSATASSSLSSSALNAESPSRRAFLTNSIAASTAAIVGLGLPSIAFAEDTNDDLAMPTLEEQQALTQAEIDEKVRRKRELQKKGNKPTTIGESFTKEKEKKADLQKSKEERRNAMCEELGRGC